MKNYISILSALTLVILFASCSGSKPLTSYEDDIYYSPKDELASATVADEYIDIDDRSYDYLESDADKSSSKEVEEYYNPDYKEELREERKSRAQEMYRDDDFYYSNRFRRFNNYNVGFGYYDPFYSYGSWYSYDPFYPRPTYWNPYFNPGFSYGWSSRWGWSMSYSAWGPGWGMGFGYAQPFGWGQPYGWGPYYGGAFGPAYYCPTAWNSGYVSNDIYNRSTNVYTGQFTPMNSSSINPNADLTRGIRQVAHNELYKGVPITTRPEATTLDGQARPMNTPSDNISRPNGQDSRPAESRPSNPELQNGTRPVDPDFGKPSQKPSNVRDERPTIDQREDSPSYVRPPATQSSPRDNSPIMSPSSPEFPRQDARPSVPTSEPVKRGLFNMGRQGNTNDRGTFRSPNRSEPAPVIRSTPSPSRQITKPTSRPYSPSRDTTRPSKSGGRR